MTAPPGKALLSVQQIVHSYGSQPVLDAISLTIHAGDRIGLIGRNGSGKSTLMRIMAGLEKPDAGLVTRSQHLRVALLSQQCALDPDQTVGGVLENAAAELRRQVADWQDATERLAALPPECAEARRLREACTVLQHQIDLSDGWHADQHINRAATSLRLPPRSRKTGTLSGGEKRRLDLAAKLILHPDVLMLDEPTNHIDPESVEWIEHFLEQYPGSCVLVTHDRYFLDRVVNRIVELEFNRLYAFPGNYARFLEYKAALEETEARAETNRQALIRRELAWYKRGPKARATKQKARINRLFDNIDTESPAQHREFLFEIPEPEPLGKIILETQNLAGGFDAEHPFFAHLNLILQKEMRIGIAGPNGCGKTTLLRVLMGLEEPLDGSLTIGESTRFLYVDQRHEEVDPEQRILDFMTGGHRYLDLNGRRIFVPAWLGRFLFDRDSAEMPIGNLSGGERNRLDLVRKLLRGGNLLVLDEPTNDLDLYTLRMLEETIDSFDGCALIVSHDRYFLNRVCTHMLVFEGGGRIAHIAGNYDDYLLYRERRAGEAKEARRAAASKTAAKAAAQAAGPRRLTWKEKQELAGMEENILLAEAEAAALEALIQETGFYEQPHETVQKCLAAWESAKTRVRDLYNRWEDLEARNSREN
jgi:ABC transport system ATP-binding/permease protein